MTNQSDTRRGMLAMAAAMWLFPISDSIAKLLTEIASPFDVTVWRIVAQALIFLPVAFVMRRHLRGPWISLPACLSGLLFAATMLCFVNAFDKMPLATVIAIFCIEPLILTVLAWPFLGERPGPRRLAAVVVGLIGALIVIRPNFMLFGPAALFPLGAATGFALNMIVLRRARGKSSTLTLQIGATFFAATIMVIASAANLLPGAGVLAVFDLPGWAIPALLLAGASVALTFVLITYAFSKAEASLLAPLQYLEIVGATVFGFIVFGDFPDALTWLGTAIILAAGIYVFHRERKIGA